MHPNSGWSEKGKAQSQGLGERPHFTGQEEAIHKRQEWVATVSKPMEVLIDMEGSEAYSSVRVGALVLKPKRLFNPTYISVSVSEDGQNYREIAHKEYPVEVQADPNCIKEYDLSFPETAARYLKLSIGCLKGVPEWHHYFGRNASVYVDEIIVE